MSATKSKFAVALLLGLVIAPPAADARITRIDIENVESPTFDGASFGSVGQYEKLTGKAYGELDPRDEANRGIVYSTRRTRNAAGRVEYSFDILILKPVDMSRGNRTLIYDSVNRGNLRAIEVFHIGANPGNNPSTERCRRWIPSEAGLHDRGERLAGRRAAGRQPADRALSRGHRAAMASRSRSSSRSHCRSPSPRTRSASATTARTSRPYPAVMERASEAQLYRRAGASRAARDDPEERVVVRQVPRRQER